jgi:DNA-binding MarR family transcriptional regulator
MAPANAVESNQRSQEQAVPCTGTFMPETSCSRNSSELVAIDPTSKGELTPTKLTALSILRREGPLSASALASRLGILPQSLTRILADLESEELLTRTRDARDGREHILELTAKARSLMRAEGIRRDAIIRETMQRALTPIEIDLLLVAAKAINKLADAWSTPDKTMVRGEEASE